MAIHIYCPLCKADNTDLVAMLQAVLGPSDPIQTFVCSQCGAEVVVPPKPSPAAICTLKNLATNGGVCIFCNKHTHHGGYTIRKCPIPVGYAPELVYSACKPCCDSWKVDAYGLGDLAEQYLNATLDFQ